MAILTRPFMADRGQEVAVAWPPHAQLGLTVPRAGRLEVDDALQPLHSPARALPSFTPPLPSPFTTEAQQHTADAIGPPSSLELAAAPQPPPSRPKLYEHPTNRAATLSEPDKL